MHNGNQLTTPYNRKQQTTQRATTSITHHTGQSLSRGLVGPVRQNVPHLQRLFTGRNVPSSRGQQLVQQIRLVLFTAQLVPFYQQVSTQPFEGLQYAETQSVPAEDAIGQPVRFLVGYASGHGMSTLQDPRRGLGGNGRDQNGRSCRRQQRRGTRHTEGRPDESHGIRPQRESRMTTFPFRQSIRQFVQVGDAKGQLFCEWYGR